ncbi:MAG: hypothetical protein ACYS8X_08670 [Planctomycetota bacterium]|jgi:pimeloyl-ACP methyl ester carboxylesterase
MNREPTALAAWWAAGLMAAMVCGGCELEASLNHEHIDRGLVVVLPGIDGPGLGTGGVMQAVADSTDLAVTQFDWTVPFAMMVNQTAEGRNRDMAALLAEQIALYQEKHPGASVYLIGHSGGTAVATWAAEVLPAGMKIDGIFLLASSLSPQYDLSPALANTREGIVSFYSHRDDALLGAGTTAFGTMDRQFCESAGKVGFRSAYGGFGGGSLRQVPWTPSMSALGYNGDHFGVCSPAFIREHVAPMMARGRASGRSVGESVAGVGSQP